MFPNFVFRLMFFLAALVYASPSPKGHVLHERREITDDEHWIKGSPIENHENVPVRIGLTQKNLEHGHELLMDISDPYSPNYGRHYTPDEIINLFAPSEDSLGLVRSWIEAAGIEASRIGLSHNKQWLQFDAKVSELESLLHTKYHQYEHSEFKKFTIGCEKYHVPHHIASHIDFIKPGVNLVEYKWYRPSRKASRDAINKRSTQRPALAPRGGPIVKPMSPETAAKVQQAPGSACDAAVTPQCFFKLYNITDNLTKIVPGNSIGIYASQYLIYNKYALDAYISSFTNAPKGSYPKFISIDGAPYTPGGGFVQHYNEADLDNQMVFSFVYPDERVNYQVDDAYYESRPQKGFLNTFLDAIDGSYCNYTAYGITGNSPEYDPIYPNPHKGGYKGKLQCGVFEPTKVISISWGYPEQKYSTAYTRRQCDELMKLSLQGITIVASSGDNGIADTFNCRGPTNQIFVPGTLVSCPYVLAVGGTYLPAGTKPVPGEEIAVNDYGSGGGFSNIFPRPKWQEAAVSNYFEKNDPGYPYYNVTYNSKPKEPTGFYNRIGRGYPDVAAIGTAAAGFAAGKGYGGKKGVAVQYGGTSVSAPVVAGIITRINHHRIASGKSSVGFITPTLYANPQLFNDVTIGVNNPSKQFGCGTHGFSAAPGWDPVTGLGTPDYGKMLDLFMALP